MNYLTRLILSLLGVSLALSPVAVSAQVGAGVGVGANAAVTSPVGSANVTMSASAMTAAKARADKELKRRIDALADVNARVQAMQSVTATFKQNLATAVEAQISAFQSLNAKIQADTDAATLKADVQSINDTYRVFVLVMPQVRIAAAADRAVTISTMMTTLGQKLAARVQAIGQAGGDTKSLEATLDSLAAHITEANAKAQASVSGSASLSPDGGDKTKMAANTAALQTARNDLKAAHAAVVAARKDIETIVKGIAAAEAAVTASASASSGQ